jgi:hypothetical protein
MKKAIVCSVLLMVFLSFAYANPEKETGAKDVGVVSLQAAGQGGVEVTFTYARQSGSASNQFAVWVEDSVGTYIKTLYASRFTASGGWKRRPLSIPQWVKQSGLASLNKQETDAVTSATPAAGALTYTWDGTNQAGAIVPAGEYTLYLEATLRNESRVVYSATVLVGSGNTGEAPVQTQYFSTEAAAKERGMITNVHIRYR